MTTNKTSVIVFDCFGVLFADAFQALLAEHEHHLPKPIAYYQRLDLLNGDGALSDRDYYAELSADFGLPESELRQKFHDTHCRLEGTVGIIKELRQKGYRIGLLSNIDRHFLDEFLSYQNTAELFDAILASSEAGANKPDRRIFEVMAQRLQAPFEEWFFTDDSQTNVDAAQSYGIASHLFTTPLRFRETLTARSLL